MVTLVAAQQSTVRVPNASDEISVLKLKIQWHPDKDNKNLFRYRFSFLALLPLKNTTFCSVSSSFLLNRPKQEIMETYSELMLQVSNLGSDLELSKSIECKSL